MQTKLSPCCIIVLLGTLTIGLGNSFNLVLLLNSIAAHKTPIMSISHKPIRLKHAQKLKNKTKKNNPCSVPVRGPFSCIDQLISQALCNSLDVSESRLASPSCQQIDGLIDTSEWWNINSLTPHNTCRPNSGCILTRTTDCPTKPIHKSSIRQCNANMLWARIIYHHIGKPYTPVNNSVHNDLDWVEVSEQVDDFHCVPDNPNSHELLPVVSSVHHQRVCEPLNDWALGLSESLHRVPPSSVGHISGVFRLWDADVILQGDVTHLKTNPNGHFIKQVQGICRWSN